LYLSYFYNGVRITNTNAVVNIINWLNHLSYQFNLHYRLS